MNLSLGCHINGENSSFISTLRPKEFVILYNQYIIISLMALSDIFPNSANFPKIQNFMYLYPVWHRGKDNIR